MSSHQPTVAIQTLGCARNDVDSEELAARLEAGGFRLVSEAEDAEAVVVNTCGFIEAAKSDSVQTLLAASDLKSDADATAVVAVGCMAERYGEELASAMPETDAVLGFDDYPDIAQRLRQVLAGEELRSHRPRDRRELLPLAPVERRAGEAPSIPGHAQPGHAQSGYVQPGYAEPGYAEPGPGEPGRPGANAASSPAARTVAAPDLPAGLAPASGPRAMRRRLGTGPMAPLKLASGCDRRCTFCAIPQFRGSFLSRPPADVLAEARWLAEQEVREVYLVSENSTSYGKDLGDLRLLESLLPQLAEVDGIERVRLSYLQPAEMRSSLVETITGTAGVAPYFDLSFQHAAPGVLRAMRRFGDPDTFLALLDQVRAGQPSAGIRTNVIVGFPGESEADLQTLCDWLEAAGLDAVGVFGYSAEDGTAAAELGGQLDEEEIRARVETVSRLTEELTAQRAEDRVGEHVDVLVEEVGESGIEGRAACQGPEVDGSTVLTGAIPAVSVGQVVPAVVSGTHGVDLTATALST